MKQERGLYTRGVYILVECSKFFMLVHCQQKELALPLHEKYPNTEFSLVLIFPVFSLRTGIYGPEKTPYLDNFYAVSRKQNIF